MASMSFAQLPLTPRIWRWRLNGNSIECMNLVHIQDCRIKKQVVMAVSRNKVIEEVSEGDAGSGEKKVRRTGKRASARTRKKVSESPDENSVANSNSGVDESLKSSGPPESSKKPRTRTWQKDSTTSSTVQDAAPEKTTRRRRTKKKGVKSKNTSHHSSAGTMVWWRQQRRCRTNFTAAAELTQKKWDAIVIGGGHNGLTAAAYLARSGLSVAVLERRHVIGGAAVTEEIIPGFKFSRCSYLQSLLRPAVVKELELSRHGLKLLKRNPSSFTPCVDGRYLLLGSDKELNSSEISKFSKRDAEAYPRYENFLESSCRFIEELLDSVPPEKLQASPSFNARMKDNMHKSIYWAYLLQRAVSMGQDKLVDFADLLLSPASKVLNKWFEADVLKATLATDAIIGATGSVKTPGSGYVLLHHVMGETDGDRGVWSYVEGGMGSVSLAIQNAATEAGATVMTKAEVSKLIVEDSGRVSGVVLADGTRLHSSVVLSNATPYKTFMEFLPHDVLPDDFCRAIKNSDYSSATTKINMAVDKLPHFRCYNLNSSDAGLQHMGTIHIGCESMEEIDAACLDYVNGRPSRRPVIEMTIPSALDKTISPPGKHIINLFIQYTPYKPRDGSWEDPEYRESFAQRCFNLIEELAPGFNSSIVGYDMLTPPDLEREIGLTGGNIFHGAMGLDSLFLMRPVKGWSSYRTPLEGLYLCGSGTHPGGGVMGAPGRNAAHVVIQDLKKKS